MSTERPLALRLLNAFEHYYSENACLRLILQQRRVPGWESALEKLMTDERFELLRGRWSAVRSAIDGGVSEEQALQQLLAVFPPNKDVN
jgi:hypothetical protein